MRFTKCKTLRLTNTRFSASYLGFLLPEWEFCNRFHKQLFHFANVYKFQRRAVRFLNAENGDFNFNFPALLPKRHEVQAKGFSMQIFTCAVAGLISIALNGSNEPGILILMMRTGHKRLQYCDCVLLSKSIELASWLVMKSAMQREWAQGVFSHPKYRLIISGEHFNVRRLEEFLLLGLLCWT